MKLSVIRHGETVENATGITQGQLPGHLSEKGIAQANSVAKQIKDIPFDYVYCSDLQRCVDTAKHLLKQRHAQVTYSRDLREISFGDFEGRPFSEIKWESIPGDFYTRRLPNGETIQEFQFRVTQFIDQLLTQHKDKHILVVTHGGPMRVIKSAIEDVDLWELYQSKPDNCAIWEFTLTAPLDV